MRTGLRWGVLAAGILVSVALSVLLHGFFLFLLLPFLFFPIVGRSPDRVCARCGFTTRHPAYRHCPRDGAPLERVP
jgi:hypothetical protein